MEKILKKRKTMKTLMGKRVRKMKKIWMGRMMAKKERKVKVKVKRMKTTVGKKMEKKKRRKEKKLARIKLMRRLLLLARIEMWSFESSRGEMNLPCFCQF